MILRKRFSYTQEKTPNIAHPFADPPSAPWLYSEEKTNCIVSERDRASNGECHVDDKLTTEFCEEELNRIITIHWDSDIDFIRSLASFLTFEKERC